SKSFVAINELAAGVENRDPCGDLVERTAMGSRLALELTLRNGKGGDIESSSTAAAIEWRCDGLINLDAAIDNGLKLQAPRLLGLAQAHQVSPLPCLEKLDLLVDRLLTGYCANRGRVGRIDPAERAFGVAKPYRDGQAVEELVAIAHRLFELLILTDQADKFLVYRG